MAAAPPPKRQFLKIKIKPTKFTNKSYHTYKVHNNKKNNNEYKSSIMTNLNETFGRNIKTNEEIIHANSGIYTWIIKGDRPDFYAARVFSEQEIGTLHQDIHRQTGGGDSPICAGELEVIVDSNVSANRTINFNIQSGTYTRNINEFHPRSEIEIINEPKLYDSIKSDLMNLYNDENLIIPRLNGKSKTPLSIKEIQKIIGMRRPEAKPIKDRIIRHINLYKKDRMVATVRKMLCSFFTKQKNECKNVIFLEGGNDDEYIKHGTLGNNAEVLAGVSLLSENKEIITTNENRNRLNRIFNVNTRKQKRS